VNVNIPGIAETVKITSAMATLTTNEVKIENLNIGISESNTTIAGSITVPRRCDVPPCSIQFNLRANALDVKEAGRWLGLAIDEHGALDQAKSLLLRDKPSWFERAAEGDLILEHMSFHGLKGDHVQTHIVWTNGKLILKDLQGEWSGNGDQTQWVGSFTGKLPYFDAQLAIQTKEGKTISLQQLLILNHNKARDH